MTDEEWMAYWGWDKPGLTDEEWDAKRLADEQWWKENRVKMAIYTVVGLFFLPLIIVIDWIGRRTESRKEKHHEG